MKKNVNENLHAKLSASGSERWINCAGSVKAEEGLPDVQNKYSIEGSLAHDVASYILTNKELKPNIDVTIDMLDNVSLYVDYVNSHTTEEASRFIEVRVDFSHVVPGGFGTADCIIKTPDILHVIDLKFGMGVSVYADDNTQLLLYAIGALNGFEGYTPKEVVMHIVQPRTNNYSKWTITLEELFKWSIFLNEKALAALKPDAIRTPSEKACRWCKAKPTCPAIYSFIDFNVMPLKEKSSLDDNDLKLIQDNSGLITDFLKSVESLIYDKLLSGNEFVGYKLVEGRSSRKFRTDGLTENELTLLKTTYKYVQPTLAEAEKLLGKDIVNSLTYKQEGKPLLVKDNDKREKIVNLFDFNDERQ